MLLAAFSLAAAPQSTTKSQPKAVRQTAEKAATQAVPANGLLDINSASPEQLNARRGTVDNKIIPASTYAKTKDMIITKQK